MLNNKPMRMLAIVLVGGLLMMAGVASVLAQGGNPPCDFGQMMGGSTGMMGGMMGGTLPEDCDASSIFGLGITGGMLGNMGMGSHMMGMMMGGMLGNFDQYGRFGPGTGMMGAWTPPADLEPAGDSLTLDEAANVAEAYIAAWDSEQPLALGEVMRFSNHFYGQAVETETGRSAFEFLIDPTTGTVIGEPGPNMMWNLRYGMTMGYGMGLWDSPQSGEEMSLSADDVRQAAQDFLDAALPGTTAEEQADAFYGYYTLHILQDGQIIGMLGVNGYTGQVWLHHWHGDFVDMIEHD
jgi:hypothetical protein